MQGLDNHYNRCNPNHTEYKGHEPRYSGAGDKAEPWQPRLLLKKDGSSLVAENPLLEL